MPEAAREPIDAIGAVAFFFGAVVIVASLGSLLLSLLALVGIAI